MIVNKIKKLFVILDTNSIMHRSFHAIPDLTTKNGELVNAVFGFSSILLTILTQEKPMYIAAAFDTAAPTFRHQMFENYKAGRIKPPREFYDQIPRIEEVIQTLNIPIFKQEGVEADDIIGTIVKTNEKQHPELTNKIITSDMDAMQLVSQKTCVGNLHQGYKASSCFHPQDVIDKYGLKPKQIVDFKALMGDSSDNIPGIKGIGKVGATQLLQEFETLDGIYEHLNQITGKKHELLAEQKEQAYFSQQLATIKTDVHIAYHLETCKAHEFDKSKVHQLFESLQFFSLIRRLGDWQKSYVIQSDDIQNIFSTTTNSSYTKKDAQETLF